MIKTKEYLKPQDALLATQIFYNIAPEGIYHNYLKSINGISFTRREIEIISFFLNGRSTKKIAYTLDISTKTVEYHASNIMQKLDCHSREGIIDFVEKSSFLFRVFYISLLNEIALEHSLAKVKSSLPTDARCLMISFATKPAEEAFLHQLKRHLCSAGFKASLEIRKEQGELERTVKNRSQATNYFTLAFFSESYAISPEIRAPISKANEVESPLCNIKYFSLSSASSADHDSSPLKQLDINQYHSSVFSILKEIYPRSQIEKIETEFKLCYQENQKHSELIKLDQSASPAAHSTLTFVNLKSYLKRPVVFISLGSILLGGVGVYWSVVGENHATTQSDMPLPIERNYLDRTKLLGEMKRSLFSSKGIQSIALTGIGGAGKTTLARHYAKEQKASFIWEINAETYSNLVSSFEKMAYSLCKTKDDQETLRGLQDIKDEKKKEERILAFTKGKLKLLPDWLLVYDNVEKLSEVQSYLPCDEKSWGNGKFIITTRDSNIGNHKLINQVIAVGELSEKEKIDLFNKIVNFSQKPRSLVTPQNIRSFLSKIPPFPLDVSVAAYYIKATNVSFANYLENLKTYSEDFDKTQEILLKESGDYTKTRYAIIALSSTLIIKAHPDFAELMALISLFDSQNIPRDLLELYKKKAVIDRFVYNLKTYSLITGENPNTPGSIPSFSIHRSMQEIILLCIVRKLNLENDKRFIKAISKAVGAYINKLVKGEDFERMRLMVEHCKMFLGHQSLLTVDVKRFIGVQLGFIYFYLDMNKEAKSILESSLVNLNDSAIKDQVYIANALNYLGVLHRDLGDLKEAKTLVKKSLMILKNHPDKHLDTTLTLVSLGSIDRELGDYREAQTVLEESLNIRNIYQESLAERALNLCHLAVIYRRLGKYQKAKGTFEESLAFYKKNHTKHMRIFLNTAYLGILEGDWGHYEKAQKLIEENLLAYIENCSATDDFVILASGHLANIHKYLGNYQKAEEYARKSVNLCNNYFPNNQTWVARSKAYLGEIQTKLGQYEEGIQLLEASLAVYINHYGNNHLETSRIREMLGGVQLEAGRIEKAEVLLTKALQGFKEADHPDIYSVYEKLAELSLKKHSQGSQGENRGEGLRKEAKQHLVKAFEILQANFPKNSPHITRVQKKLNNA